MKMSFKHDHNKQGQEFIFLRKIKQVSYPLLNLNNNSVKQPLFQKKVEVYLESTLNPWKHLQ